MPITLPERINLYAKLLHSKIDGSVRIFFPITRDLIGAALWQEFIRVHHRQSTLYREIPDEFIDYLMHKNPQRELPEIHFIELNAVTARLN